MCRRSWPRSSSPSRAGTACPRASGDCSRAVLKGIRRSGCATSATSGSYSMTGRQFPHERPASLAGQPQDCLRSWRPWRFTPALVVQPLLRLEADLGKEVSLVPLATPTVSSVVISPDGTRLVFVGTISGGPPKLLTRRLDQPDATELAGTEGAVNPFFSRDGQWVAFWTGNELYKVP